MKNVQMMKRTAILNYVEANGPMRRREIQKFIKVDLNGQTYDPIRDRGYYCHAFWDRSCYCRRIGLPNYGPILTSPRDYDKRFLKKNDAGLYYVTE